MSCRFQLCPPPRGGATRSVTPPSSEGPILAADLPVLFLCPLLVSLAPLAWVGGTYCHHCQIRGTGVGERRGKRISLRPKETLQIGTVVSTFLGLSCGHTKFSLHVGPCQRPLLPSNRCIDYSYPEMGDLGRAAWIEIACSPPPPCLPQPFILKLINQRCQMQSLSHNPAPCPNILVTWET